MLAPFLHGRFGELVQPFLILKGSGGKNPIFTPWVERIDGTSLTWKSEDIMRAMRKKMKFGKSMGFLLILFSAILFLWLLWPFSQKSQEISFQPGELIFSEINYSDSIPSQATEVYAIPYGTQIILKWMPVIRKGGLETIHLQVIQDERYMEGSGTVESNTVLTEVKMLNIFENYSIMAKSRLDMNNAIVDPPGESGVALSEAGKVTFSWEISPQEAGHLSGTVWFFLVAFADEGNEVI